MTFSKYLLSGALGNSLGILWCRAVVLEDSLGLEAPRGPEKNSWSWYLVFTEWSWSWKKSVADSTVYNYSLLYNIDDYDKKIGMSYFILKTQLVYLLMCSVKDWAAKNYPWDFVEQKYKEQAISCWIATAVYVVTFAISVYMVSVNKKAKYNVATKAPKIRHSAFS